MNGKVSLKEVSERVDYGLTTSAVLNGDGPKFLRITDIDGSFIDWDSVPRCDASDSESAKYALLDGDIVVARTGASTGRSQWVQIDEPSVFASYLVRFRVQSNMDSRFVGYVLNTTRWFDHVSSVAHGKSAQPNMSASEMARFEFVCPSLSEQQAIAEVLGALDDKIAANTKLAATADDLIEVRFRQAIASEGTESIPLFEAIDVDFGEPFKGSYFSEPGTGRPLIRIRDLKTFTSQVWTTEYRTREVLVQPGDVVVGMDAEFRPTSWLGEPGLLNQRVLRARGRTTGPAFVRETLKEPLSWIEGYKTATTVIHLNKKDLEETVVLVPRSASLGLFEASVEGLYSQRVSMALENRKLGDVRVALLPQLMSGKLRVKDAEKVLENAGL